MTLYMTVRWEEGTPDRYLYLGPDKSIAEAVATDLASSLGMTRINYEVEWAKSHSGYSSLGVGQLIADWSTGRNDGQGVVKIIRFDLV